MIFMEKSLTKIPSDYKNTGLWLLGHTAAYEAIICEVLNAKERISYADR